MTNAQEQAFKQIVQAWHDRTSQGRSADCEIRDIFAFVADVIADKPVPNNDPMGGKNTAFW